MKFTKFINCSWGKWSNLYIILTKTSRNTALFICDDGGWGLKLKYIFFSLLCTLTVFSFLTTSISVLFILLIMIWLFETLKAQVVRILLLKSVEQAHLVALITTIRKGRTHLSGLEIIAWVCITLILLLLITPILLFWLIFFFIFL